MHGLQWGSSHDGISTFLALSLCSILGSQLTSFWEVLGAPLLHVSCHHTASKWVAALSPINRGPEGTPALLQAWLQHPLTVPLPSPGFIFWQLQSELPPCPLDHMALTRQDGAYQFLIWALSLCDWHSSWPHQAFVSSPTSCMETNRHSRLCPMIGCYISFPINPKMWYSTIEWSQFQHQLSHYSDQTQSLDSQWDLLYTELYLQIITYDTSMD
jgi:hypothetical protein